MDFEPPLWFHTGPKNAVQTRNHSATIQVINLFGYLALYAYDILFTDINGNLRLYSFTFDSIPTHPFSRISRYLKVQKHVNKHCGYYSYSIDGIHNHNNNFMPYANAEMNKQKASIIAAMFISLGLQDTSLTKLNEINHDQGMKHAFLPEKICT